jgi:AbrB family looped-hinge helix DNA binding protein
VAVVKTTPKGQVMIPAAVRRKVGLKPGDRVAVEPEGDGTIRVTPLPDDPAAALHGMLRGAGRGVAADLAREHREEIKRDAAVRPRRVRRARPAPR